MKKPFAEPSVELLPLNRASVLVTSEGWDDSQCQSYSCTSCVGPDGCGIWNYREPEQEPTQGGDPIVCSGCDKEVPCDTGGGTGQGCGTCDEGQECNSETCGGCTSNLADLD